MSGLLFTYGVTGSGKTYTTLGDHRNPGLVPRVIKDLIKIKSVAEGNDYNEKIVESSQEKTPKDIESGKLYIAKKTRYQNTKIIQYDNCYKGISNLQ